MAVLVKKAASEIVHKLGDTVLVNNCRHHLQGTEFAVFAEPKSSHDHQLAVGAVFADSQRLTTLRWCNNDMNEMIGSIVYDLCSDQGHQTFSHVELEALLLIS